MPEHNQPIEEKAVAEKRNLDHEELLLLLELNVVYSTGDILDHLQLDVRVPEAQKSELRDRRSRAQSYLSRYLFQKEGALHRFFESDLLLAENAKLILTPIRKEPYRGKRVNQRLYLGAQYVYVAERMLGRKTTVATKELLGLIAQAQESPTRFSKGEFVRGIYKGRLGVSVVPHTKIQQLAGRLGLWPQKAYSPRAANRTSTISIPKNLVGAVLLVSLGLSTGLAAGKYVFEKSEKELWDQFRKEWTEKGPASLESISLDSPIKNEIERTKRLWATALEIDVDIKTVEQIAEPLLNHIETLKIAKARYSLGVAYLRRGMIHPAIESFSLSADLYESLPSEKATLRRTYLYLAECYFYLKKESFVLDFTDRARDVEVTSYESNVVRFYGLHYLMLGDLANAKHHLETALDLSLLEGSKNRTGDYHANLALVLIGTGDLTKAFHHLNTAESIAQETNNKGLMDFALSLKIIWAKQMNLPADALKNQLHKSKDPIFGSYVNIFTGYIQE